MANLSQDLILGYSFIFWSDIFVLFFFFFSHKNKWYFNFKFLSIFIFFPFPSLYLLFWSVFHRWFQFVGFILINLHKHIHTMLTVGYTYIHTYAPMYEIIHIYNNFTFSSYVWEWILHKMCSLLQIVKTLDESVLSLIIMLKKTLSFCFMEVMHCVEHKCLF